MWSLLILPALLVNKKIDKKMQDKLQQVSPVILVTSVIVGILLVREIWGETLLTTHYPSLLIKYLFLSINYLLLIIASWCAITVGVCLILKSK